MGAGDDAAMPVWTKAEAAARPVAAGAGAGVGVAISLRGLGVQAGGHVILRDVTIEIQPGEHVAIVGPSGAGKSTLVGVLLGWHAAARGEVLIDGEPLDESKLDDLRRETAWADPGVRLWNRSLVENLRYGGDGDGFGIGDRHRAAQGGPRDHARRHADTAGRGGRAGVRWGRAAGAAGASPDAARRRVS